MFDYIAPKVPAKSVSIKFKNKSTKYDYLVLPDHAAKIKKGDNVIVDSPYSGIEVVEVVSVSAIAKGSKYILDIVDLTAAEIAKDKQRIAELYRNIEVHQKAIDKHMAELVTLGG